MANRPPPAWACSRFKGGDTPLAQGWNTSFLIRVSGGRWRSLAGFRALSWWSSRAEHRIRGRIGKDSGLDNRPWFRAMWRGCGPIGKDLTFHPPGTHLSEAPPAPAWPSRPEYDQRSGRPPGGPKNLYNTLLDLSLRRRLGTRPRPGSGEIFLPSSAKPPGERGTRAFSLCDFGNINPPLAPRMTAMNVVLITTPDEANYKDWAKQQEAGLLCFPRPSRSDVLEAFVARN